MITATVNVYKIMTVSRMENVESVRTGHLGGIATFNDGQVVKFTFDDHRLIAIYRQNKRGGINYQTNHVARFSASRRDALEKKFTEDYPEARRLRDSIEDHDRRQAIEAQAKHERESRLHAGAEAMAAALAPFAALWGDGSEWGTVDTDKEVNVLVTPDQIKAAFLAYNLTTEEAPAFIADKQKEPPAPLYAGTAQSYEYARRMAEDILGRAQAEDSKGLLMFKGKWCRFEWLENHEEIKIKGSRAISLPKKFQIVPI